MKTLVSLPHNLLLSDLSYPSQAEIRIEIRVSSSFESDSPTASPRSRSPHTATHLSKPPTYTIHFSQTVNTCRSPKKLHPWNALCLSGPPPKNTRLVTSKCHFRNSFLMLQTETLPPLKPHSDSDVAFELSFLHLNIYSSTFKQQTSHNHHLQEPPYSFLAPSTARTGRRGYQESCAGWGRKNFHGVEFHSKNLTNDLPQRINER